MNSGIKPCPAGAADYVSDLITWPSSAVTNTLFHGLRRTPAFIRLVFVNKVSEYGYKPGEELQAAGSSARLDADAACINVYVTAVGETIFRKDTLGVTASLTPASWGYKVYAS